MAVDRRAELVQAGLELVAKLRFHDVLNAVETRAIAESAGVTTGSFFHHFRSREHYTAAVVERWAQLWDERVARLTAGSVEAADATRPGGFRSAADDEWAALADAGPMEAVQRLLWALRHQPVADDTHVTGAELLGRSYCRLADSVMANYARGLRAMGREPMPPFDQHDMEVVTTALAEGLQLRAAVQDGAVRPDLYRDAISAFLLGGTRPRRTRGGDESDDVDLDRLARRLGRPVAEGRDVADVTARRGERWRQIADDAAHLFVDRSPHQVRFSEVAASAGVGVEVVRQHFESVVAVAATSWVRHVPELEAIAASPALDGLDPLRRIEAVLLRYVELVRENRGAAEAMVTQVMAQMGPATGDLRLDLRVLVPIPSLVAPSIEELRQARRLRRRVEIMRLARSLVHLVTMQALLFPDESTERVVDEAMAMVFDGALVEPSDA